ncbi:MAG: hypothetical protein BAJALOKI3v1_500019 [Promethearchaeota archaeon]|nr:MAG: hypothetical protein BAJALOKI3v1_500019 [Candidatus Lokiarchaeota archaeon]
MNKQIERTFKKISVKYIKNFQREKEDKAIAPDEFYTTIVKDSEIRQETLENEDELKMGRLWNKYSNFRR